MRESFIGLPDLVFKEMESNEVLKNFLTITKNLVHLIKKISYWERDDRSHRRSYFLRMKLSDAIDKLHASELSYMKWDTFTKALDFFEKNPELMQKYALAKLSKEDELFVVERELNEVVELISKGDINNDKLLALKEHLKFFTIQEAMKKKYRWFWHMFHGNDIDVFAADVKLTISCLDEVLNRNTNGDYSANQNLSEVLSIDSEIKNINAMIAYYENRFMTDRYEVNVVGDSFKQKKFDLDYLYGEEKHFYIVDLVRGWNETLSDTIEQFNSFKDELTPVKSLIRRRISISRYKDPELIDIFYKKFHDRIKNVYEIVKDKDYIFMFKDIESFTGDILKFQKNYSLFNLVDMKFGYSEMNDVKNDELLNLILYFSKVVGQICHEVRLLDRYLYLSYGKEKINSLQASF